MTTKSKFGFRARPAFDVMLRKATGHSGSSEQGRAALICKRNAGWTMSHSRRDFVKSTLLGLPVSAALARAAETKNTSTIGGVQLGVQTYSFHDILNDGRNHTDATI